MKKEKGINIRIAFATVGIMTVLGAEISAWSFQQKELAFAQVAVGPQIETVICVTNRGYSDYRGTVRFWRGQDEDWNPVVNGRPVAGSAVELVVGPGETRILRLTGNSVAAGAAVIDSKDSSLDSFIEGNLTYSIDGPGYDSVGIPPSMGLYRTVIPFEDFEAVGLAVANPDLTAPALLRMRLLDESGRELESVDRILGRRSHESRFLSQIFDRATGSGKVEIDSSRPVLGTAVTLALGEISALPMQPSPVRYTFDSDSGLEADHAELVLWAEGVFLKGYLRFLEVDTKPVANPENFIVTGTLVDGVLRLTQMGAGEAVGGMEPLSGLRLFGFSFQGVRWTGTYTRSVHGFPFDHTIEGGFELTRVD